MDLTTQQAKAAARALRTALAEEGVEVGHARALELVARQLGARDWNTASAWLGAPRAVEPSTGPVVPVLRIQDEALARELYVEYLGFVVEWEHRFDPEAPLYLQVRRGASVLHLSEHHGDGVPGTVVRIPVSDLRALHDEVAARGHRRVRPGIESSPGGATMEVPDPFGNALRFYQA
ncbi:bleomycin resistance family protein [Cellulomonas sp. DKR-3]|uniref:Bleomycin resistance protein n=1 Tax=Cellulomonas fulva TaxID=2835530 RepID=A0ABS5U0B4_9CELL|nr:glyoxalase superfamily protein [Cellulomonas fulva]MBT0994858.1 bleomycin resistance family protein [Cellulomonas fulva]